MIPAFLRTALAGAAAACLAAPAGAFTLGDNDALTLSGFASAVAGKVLSGERQEHYYRYPCPCFIADYGHGALYGPTWQVKQESKVGVQGAYALTPQLSATAQVVGRGVDGVKTRLEWAYLSYDVNDSWTVQVGRKRLPIYYYSDFQDVGYAYTWVRPPADIYGWEIVNYNGINATYRADWAGWAVKSNVFFGREDSRGNLMQRLYYDDPQNVTWRKIFGGDLLLTRGILTTRATYIQNKVDQISQVDGTHEPDGGKQRIYGLAANLDIERWFVRSEYSVFDRSAYSYRSRAYMVGAGGRFGDFTPMLTHTRYRERNRFTPDAIQHDRGWSATLRYELGTSSALKVQWDHFKDLSGTDLSYVGTSKLLSVALDTVF
jgi:predicted porin